MQKVRNVIKYKNKTKIGNEKSKDKQIKYIDLFCGIGSFHYSFKKLGFECVMASDNCKPVKLIYKRNYDIMPLDDICDINPSDIESYDILCAGFPCQPFSQAGKHLGFNDKRGTMFYQVIKFVKINKPKIIILENVKGLLTHDKGNTLKTMIKELENEKYSVIYKVLKCSDYGIPQMRKRLFTICFKNIKTKNIENFFNLTKYEKNTTLTKYLNKDFEKDTAYTIRCGGKRSPIDDRHNWDGYWIKENGIRKEYRLSVDDALKLQGFENFKFEGNKKDLWKMLGNTIPTIFTQIIGNQILKHFEF